MIGDNIKKYRLINQMSLRDLASLVGVSQTAIMKYEKNLLVPDGERISRIASALQVTSADLLRPTKEKKSPSLFFHNSAALSKKEVERLSSVLDDRVNDYLEVLDFLGVKAPRIQSYPVSSIEEAKKAASFFRQDYGLSLSQPLPNLVDALENIGIRLVFFSKQFGWGESMDGMVQVIDGFPFVCIRKGESLFRQRLILAHELGHLVLSIQEKAHQEELCDAFAASLLLPKESLLSEFGEKRKELSEEELMECRREYGVSVRLILDQLLENGIISKTRYQKEVARYNKTFKEEEANVPPETSKQFVRLVHRLYAEGQISESKQRFLLRNEERKRPFLPNSNN